MKWNDKKEVKKGSLGERIVKSSLEKKGYVVYEPTTDKAHAFDFLAVKDKRVFIVAEVKSKARLNKFNATGIEVRHYNDYSFVLDSQNIEVILFFVDEHPDEQRIYCQRLSELRKPCDFGGVNYPNFDIVKNIVLFPIEKMIHVSYLSDDEAIKLRELSNRNYNYN